MFVMIIGGEPTGVQLAAFLVEQKHKVRLIESRPDILATIHRKIPTEVIFQGRATDLGVLEQSGVGDVDAFVACTPDDSINLLLCYLANQKYNVPRTIGRINDPGHAWLFDDVFHVDVALNESTILAHLIEEEMSLGDMMTLLKLRRGQYSLIEVVIPEGAEASGMEIRDLKLPERSLIVAIIRQNDMVLPRGDTSLEVGDEVLVVTDSEGAEQLAELFAFQG
jgi:trk system potassium uptake protein TrkA